MLTVSIAIVVHDSIDFDGYQSTLSERCVAALITTLDFPYRYYGYDWRDG
jgi:hypothetical protein